MCVGVDVQEKGREVTSEGERARLKGGKSERDIRSLSRSINPVMPNQI